MTIISNLLKSSNKRSSLIPFITAGYPDLYTTEKALEIFDRLGVDVIELGLPYSDPLADGPIIQEASSKALKTGVTIDHILQLLEKVKSKIKTPLILFTYYNPIIARGIQSFIMEISHAGFKGLIIPDLPLEEADYIISLCKNFSIELILLLTPTSSSQRIEKIINKSQGVIYVVSSTGVTGIRENIQIEMKDFISNLRAMTDQALILGFGISQAKHVQQIMDWDIDGIVIGSAFVRCLSDSDYGNGLVRLEEFCNSIVSVIQMQENK
uniref:Tryptophan synthase alpha chain n=1 Tax=Dichotomaria marginata TaxID=268567 RepID=A0A1G4NSF4_9FLOR|nr:Tryptophan synthase alpha subunit [Dichotomaria marginata]SCW21496.1 Tryptophan synthase alpha subunit [Dichotomaria marginata]